MARDDPTAAAQRARGQSRRLAGGAWPSMDAGCARWCLRAWAKPRPPTTCCRRSRRPRSRKATSCATRPARAVVVSAGGGGGAAISAAPRPAAEADRSVRRSAAAHRQRQSASRIRSIGCWPTSRRRSSGKRSTAAATRRRNPAAQIHRGLVVPAIGGTFGTEHQRRGSAAAPSAAKNAAGIAPARSEFEGRTTSADEVIDAMNARQVFNRRHSCSTAWSTASFRAASGEQLLASLDDQPDGWRRCALAFLEAQSWRKSLRQIRARRAATAATRKNHCRAQMRAATKEVVRHGMPMAGGCGQPAGGIYIGHMARETAADRLPNNRGQ